MKSIYCRYRDVTRTILEVLEDESGDLDLGGLLEKKAQLFSEIEGSDWKSDQDAVKILQEVQVLERRSIEVARERQESITRQLTEMTRKREAVRAYSRRI